MIMPCERVYLCQSFRMAVKRAIGRILSPDLVTSILDPIERTIAGGGGASGFKPTKLSQERYSTVGGGRIGFKAKKNTFP